MKVFILLFVVGVAFLTLLLMVEGGKIPGNDSTLNQPKCRTSEQGKGECMGKDKCLQDGGSQNVFLTCKNGEICCVPLESCESVGGKCVHPGCNVSAGYQSISGKCSSKLDSCCQKLN